MDELEDYTESGGRAETSDAAEMVKTWRNGFIDG
jgi:hypothetical protein